MSTFTRPTKDEARKGIAGLVDIFSRNNEIYQKEKGTKEAQIEDQYIKPFWEFLGWDVFNKSGKSPDYQEVVVQDRIEGTSREPDYGFAIDGQKLFFLEAKQPIEKVKENKDHAQQARSYGWSAGHPFSILSDFEEFAIYDTRIEPKKGDGAHVARLEYFTYTQYLEKFDWIWDTFAYENVDNGSLKRYISGIKEIKGSVSVDVAFLNSLNGWRKPLAEDMIANHPGMSDYELTYHVQQTLDRLIFLRVCEDREIEKYGSLLEIAQKNHKIYQHLLTAFDRANKRYNSGLFSLKKEDKFAETEAKRYWDSGLLTIGDAVLRSVIEDLYQPKSPYAFAVIPVEILGNAYEQFLGKVIRVAPAAKKGGKPTIVIEEKPEVRKAGGVFYTPQYIVDYMVKKTVGEWVKGKTPAEVVKLRICDPACGSGSFLLGAYKFLLVWHLEYYANQYTQTKKRPAELAFGKRGDVSSARLTTATKKQILTNNIYGVDLDAQAVEVAKLSLMLQALAGETRESVADLVEEKQHVLPSLDKNIRDGNSIVGKDYEGDLLFDIGLSRSINSFDWQTAFSDVLTKQGGFDVILGNPPYVRQELLTHYKSYLPKYTVHHNMADLYVYFFQKSLGDLLRPGGSLGFIVANKWMRAGYGEKLRKYLQTSFTIDEITDFGDLPVFKNVMAYPCIVLVTRTAATPRSSFAGCNVDTLDFKDLAAYVRKNSLKVSQKDLDTDGWKLIPATEKALLTKIRKAGLPLGEYVKGKIFYGIKTGLNEAFVIDRATRDALVKADKKSAEIIKPFLAGKDVKRYEQPSSDKFLIFAKRGLDIARYPAIKQHLEQFKTQLMPKPKTYKGDDWPGRKPGSYQWYELQDAIDYFEEFEKPHIIIPTIVNKASYVLDKEGFYSNDKTSIIGVADLYLLAVLNSKPCDHFLKANAATKAGGYFEYKPVYVAQLPIPVLDLKDKAQKALHAQLGKLAGEMMELHTRLRASISPAERNSIEGRITLTDREINAKVHALYGLTEEEIQVVEGNK